MNIVLNRPLSHLLPNLVASLFAEFLAMLENFVEVN